MVADVGAIVGKVELGGVPPRSYTVHLNDGQGSEFSHLGSEVIHAADGRFEIRGIPVGALEIELTGIGFQPKKLATTVVANRDTDLGTIALDVGQRIRGRVVDSSHIGIAGASVTVHQRGDFYLSSAEELAAEGSVSTRTDAAGNFELAGFPASPDNRIVASTSRGTSGERSLGAQSTVELMIRAGGAIEGTLDDYDANISVSRVDDRDFEATCRMDRLNRFTCDNLEPGTYLVFVPYSPVIPKRATVTAGQRTRVDLTSSKVRVDALFAFATPCTALELQTDDDNHDRIRSAKCEWRELRGIIPGRYRVCTDGRCTSITLADSPTEQHFQLP